MAKTKLATFVWSLAAKMFLKLSVQAHKLRILLECLHTYCEDGSIRNFSAFRKYYLLRLKMDALLHLINNK